MNALTIDIRQAEVRDAAAIAEVHAQTWQHAYAGIIPHHALRAMINRRGPQWWRRAIERGTSILLIDMGSQIAGYATFGLNRAKALSQESEIYELYVLPTYQGLGLGTRLFKAARNTLLDHGCDGLVVWALEDNEMANRFYQGLGGTDVAEGHEVFDGRSLQKIAYIWS